MLPDIGGVELVIVALIALLVFKPEDLPGVMKKFGQFMGNAKRMAADFRASFDDMARQSELDELRKEVQSMRAQASKIASDPLGGVTDVLSRTEDEIRGSLGEPGYDPDFNYGQPLKEDTSITPEEADRRYEADKAAALEQAKAKAKPPVKPRAPRKPKPKDIVT